MIKAMHRVPTGYSPSGKRINWDDGSADLGFADSRARGNAMRDQLSLSLNHGQQPGVSKTARIV